MGLSLLLVVVCTMAGYMVAWPLASLTAIAGGVESLHFTSLTEPFFFPLRMGAALALAPVMAFCLNLFHRIRQGEDLSHRSFLAVSGGLVAAVAVAFVINARKR